MGKSVLKIKYEFPFIVFGIVTGVKDYRLCHFINKTLQMNFVRMDDLHMVINKQGDEAIFTYFSDDTYSPEKHLIIVNKGNQTWFFPEIKNVDYLYIVHQPDKGFNEDEMLMKLRQPEIINGAYPIDYEKLKSKDNLLYLS